MPLPDTTSSVLIHAWFARHYARRKQRNLDVRHARIVPCSLGDHNIVYDGNGRVIMNACPLKESRTRKVWQLLNPQAPLCTTRLAQMPRAMKLSHARGDYKYVDDGADFRGFPWSLRRLQAAARVVVFFLRQQNTRGIDEAARIGNRALFVHTFTKIAKHYRDSTFRIDVENVQMDIKAVSWLGTPQLTHAIWEAEAARHLHDARFDLAFCAEYRLPSITRLSIYKQREAQRAWRKFRTALKYAVRRWFALHELPFVPWRIHQAPEELP